MWKVKSACLYTLSVIVLINKHYPYWKSC
jgi:hypothetical protein